MCPWLHCVLHTLQYVIELREQILSTPCDFATLHNLLVHAPTGGLTKQQIILMQHLQQPFPMASVVARAYDIFERFPLRRLRSRCSDELVDLIEEHK